MKTKEILEGSTTFKYSTVRKCVSFRESKSYADDNAIDQYEYVSYAWDFIMFSNVVRISPFFF